MISPDSPIPALIIVLAAIATSAGIVVLFGGPEKQGRYATIDGLRGYLALFVFIQHISIWYYFLRTGSWELPPNHLYAHLGKWGVYMFFMITGFLFFSKMIEEKKSGVDWARLFISRIFRITPLYIFAVLCVVLVVAYQTHGVLVESVPDLARQLSSWLAFTFFGAPDINHLPDTARIIASVVWSLPYEWFFYFSLPVISLLIGGRPSWPYACLGFAAIILFVLWRPESNAFINFMPGMVAAVLARSEAVRRYARSHFLSVAVVAGLTFAAIAYPTANSGVVFVILSLSFIAISCGNTMFGILTARASALLGEVSYSLYLLHGITLYLLFEVVIGKDAAREFSFIRHWEVACLDAPVLVILCFITFRLIERGPMKSVSKVMAWLDVWRLSDRRADPLRGFDRPIAGFQPVQPQDERAGLAQGALLQGATAGGPHGPPGISEGGVPLIGQDAALAPEPR